MKEIVDATEMFLRTIYELQEEGVQPLRARLAERLDQSIPTVKQTIGRMERLGLVIVSEDRHLELTESGQRRAIEVMRKHRLAECLLVEVIGLELEHVHAEACRWEHVMSESVELKIFALLNRPTRSPHGNPIPGLHQLEHPDEPAAADRPVFEPGLERLDEHAHRGGGTAEIRRIGEHVQADVELMAQLGVAGVIVGHAVTVAAIVNLGEAVTVHTALGSADIPPLLAHAVLIRERHTVA